MLWDTDIQKYSFRKNCLGLGVRILGLGFVVWDYPFRDGSFRSVTDSYDVRLSERTVWYMVSLRNVCNSSSLSILQEATIEPALTCVRHIYHLLLPFEINIRL